VFVSKTIDNYVPVVKMVVASAVDEEGEEIYPQKWNHEFIDLPVVEKSKQNTPSFSAEVMTGLARWKKKRERKIFVLCGAGGFRVGEVLGIEIDKHLSPDFLTIFIQQKIHYGRVEQRLKTANGCRQADLHPTIASLLKEFVDNRASGFLFCTRQGKPVSPSNIIRRHLHQALKELGCQSVPGTHKAGNHAFRRFRNTYLWNYAECPEGLYKYWMGHAGRT
jgi:integrase